MQMLWEAIHVKIEMEEYQDVFTIEILLIAISRKYLDSYWKYPKCFLKLSQWFPYPIQGCLNSIIGPRQNSALMPYLQNHSQEYKCLMVDKIIYCIGTSDKRSV